MKRAAILLYVLLGFAAVGLFGVEDLNSPAAIFAEGNAGYQKGDFQTAERQYRNLINIGVEESAVYYNLANACFKQKKLGEAIYYWEKARLLQPGDPDIRENLELANLLLVDRIEAPQDPLPLRVFDRAVHLLTITQASWLGLAFFIAANCLFGFHILTKNPRLAMANLVGSLVAGLLVLFFACSLSWRVYESNHRRQGVIVEEKVDLRSGPGTENITVFTVHEGVKVRVRAGAAGWYQVSLSNGWSGWLPQSSIRIL